jgi:hypothetical protein
MSKHHTHIEVVMEDTGQRWDFTIEHGIYGKLVCSYYPREGENHLQHCFDRIFTKPQGKHSILEFGPALHCYHQAYNLMKEKIAHNIHDSMIGFIKEVFLETLIELNGWEFNLKLDAAKKMKSIRDFHSKASGLRMGARQGRKADRAAFIKQVLEAYGKAHDELAEEQRKKILDKYKKDRAKREAYKHAAFVNMPVTMQLVAKKMSGLGITYNSLKEQLERYQLTIEDLQEEYYHRQQEIWRIENLHLDDEENAD